VRREVLAANPDQPVFAVRPVDEILAESVAAERFSARLSSRASCRRGDPASILQGE
jgi:hypothetical protein